MKPMALISQQFPDVIHKFGSQCVYVRRLIGPVTAFLVLHKRKNSVIQGHLFKQFELAFCRAKMLNGFRILLFIVLLLGIVLISGYTYLMFGDDIASVGTLNSVESPVYINVGKSKSVASPLVQKSRTFLEVELQYSPLATTLPHVEAPTSKPTRMLFWKLMFFRCIS